MAAKKKSYASAKKAVEAVQTELDKLDPDSDMGSDEPDTNDPAALAIAPSAAGRRETLAKLIGLADKIYGKGALSTLGGPEAGAEDGLEVVDTGSIGLNEALGVNGYPTGRIIEIYGAESSGKTTLALTAVANVQASGGIAAYVDVEHALDPPYARALGVNLEELLFAQPDNGEQALELVEQLVSSGEVSIVVVDSVAALVTKAELEGTMSDSQPGSQARLMSKALRKLTGTVHRTKTLLIFINQTREKIGVMFGSPKTTSGGNALKFYASVRLEVTRTGSEKKGDEATGNTTKVKVVKNKVSPPFKTCEFTIVFGQGISQVGEVLDAALKEKIITKSGAWFAYNGANVGQGMQNTRTWLEDNPALMKEIRAEITRRRRP